MFLLVYSCFIFCSSLFTMFEFTKLIYLWRCIFIHFYFCTMFFFFWSPVFLFLVCKIFLLLLLLWKHFSLLCLVCFYKAVTLWPRTCEPEQNLHVDQYLRSISHPVYDHSDQLLILRGKRNVLILILILILTFIRTCRMFWVNKFEPCVSV